MQQDDALVGILVAVRQAPAHALEPQGRSQKEQGDDHDAGPADRARQRGQRGEHAAAEAFGRTRHSTQDTVLATEIGGQRTTRSSKSGSLKAISPVRVDFAIDWPSHSTIGFGKSFVCATAKIDRCDATHWTVKVVRSVTAAKKRRQGSNGTSLIVIGG